MIVSNNPWCDTPVFGNKITVKVESDQAFYVLVTVPKITQNQGTA